MRSHLLPQRIRHRRVEAGRYAKAADAIGTDFGQPLGIGHREASESDRINQLKDGGVGADAKGKRQDRDGGKHGSASKSSETVLCVADDVIHGLDREEAYWDLVPIRKRKKKVEESSGATARIESRWHCTECLVRPGVSSRH